MRLLSEKSEHLAIADLVSGRPDRALRLFLLIHQRFVIGQSRGVSEQMTNGDGAAVGGESGENFGEVPIIRKFAVVHEQHNGHGRKLFGKRGQAKIRTRADSVKGSEIAQAVAAGEDSPAVLSHEHGGARRFRIDQRRKDRLNSGFGSSGKNAAATSRNSHNFDAKKGIWKAARTVEPPSEA